MLAKEVLGVTWDETYKDDENYTKDTYYFRISKELQKVDINLVKVTSTQEIIVI